MPNVALQFPQRAGGVTAARTLIGPVTTNIYQVDGVGRCVFDTQDSPYWLAQGWVYANMADTGTGGLPSFGTAVVDFGAFPGKPLAEVTVAGASIDLNAFLEVQVANIATADHTADEHSVDPPLVSAQPVGNTVVIRAVCSGRDRPVPPGIPFGQVNTSQMPIPRRQPTPYGKWNVAWAFVA